MGFVLKELTYTRSKGKRTIEVEISINTAKDVSSKVFYLRIRLLYAGNDDFITIMTGEHSLSQDICLDNDKIINYIKDLESIKALTEAYLAGEEIDTVVRDLHRELGIIDITNEEYCLYRHGWSTLLAYKYGYNGPLLLKNGHHFFEVVKDILHYRDIDFEKRTIVQVATLIPDIVKLIGLKQYEIHEGSDFRFFHFVKDGKEIECQNYVPMTETMLKRKVRSGNHFSVDAEIKKQFGVKYSKYALMLVKPHLWIEVDSEYNIKKIDIYKSKTA